MRFFIFLLPFLALSCADTKVKVVIEHPKLTESVEIIRDQYGINHIYAQNQQDLFFAQGYAAAADRLFQFEIWRRQATGTVAEILGPRELKRDIGTRLFKFRGNLQEEYNYYHDQGAEIMEAYTNGVNAYIEEVLGDTTLLPIEFKILGILPELWTPEVIISRHQGLLGNINDELNIGRAVAASSPELVQAIQWFHPKKPGIALDPSITAEVLAPDILALYQAYRKPVSFQLEDIVSRYRKQTKEVGWLDIPSGKDKVLEFDLEDPYSIGSNNWIVAGSRMADGFPIMANDPHRTIANPSLRYMVHLNAPGWNVIGGGEPTIPGVSIGHNEFGAWGLTVFSTDGEDLMVYDIHPEDSTQYWYQGAWRKFEIIQDTIPVKGQNPEIVDLFYSVHGPVTLIEPTLGKAYAVRCAWLEPGGAPYLASLRMDQATNWEEFRTACAYSHIPGENMIWADIHGDIGWQAVGIAPIRNTHSGLVPVPGDGRYDWEGYLPILDKPHITNPESGYFATANQNVTPATYRHWEAIGFSWSDPFRGDRIQNFFDDRTNYTMQDMQELQTDYYAMAANDLIPMLENLNVEDEYQEAKDYLLRWDRILSPQSVGASIYNEWENQIRKMAARVWIPSTIQPHLKNVQLTQIIRYLKDGLPEVLNFSPMNRETLLLESFTLAVKELTQRGGADLSNWKYGQPALKHAFVKHPLGDWVDDSLAQIMNIGPLPRGGNAYTVGSTGGNYRQSSGASFRLIVKVGDWDHSAAMNAPGQSGIPNNKFYQNLFPMWAQDQYFPLWFDYSEIKKHQNEIKILSPP
jgi:penicillin amidase